MTHRTLVLLAGAGSLYLLMAAFGFQYLGFAPCKLCLWQRWPHAAAILIAAVMILWGLRPLAFAGALAAVTSAGIGAYHTGVERGWWEGPTSCSGGGNALDGLSGSDLLSLDAPVNIVMCDDVAWSLFGISMASWNMLASLGLALIWIMAARRAA